MAMKSLKFLIFNTEYPDFLRWLDAQHPGLEKQFYEEQMHLPTFESFWCGGLLLQKPSQSGREVWDIHVC